MPYAVGLILFAIGLLVGGLAPSMLVLVAARFVQGLGAGTLQPIAYVAIGRTLPETLRPRMFAVLSTAWVLPGVIGPAIAGTVGENIGWRIVFLGLLPLIGLAGALTLGALRAVAPAPVNPDDPAAAARRGRLPLALAVALGAGLLTVGLTTGQPVATVGLSAVGAVILIAALRRLTPAGTLVARPVLPAAILLRGILTCAFFGIDAFVALTLVDWRGISATAGRDRADRGDDLVDGRRLDPGPRRRALADPSVRPGRVRGRRARSHRDALRHQPRHHVAGGDPRVRRGRSRDGPRLLAVGAHRPARGGGRDAGRLPPAPCR